MGQKQDKPTGEGSPGAEGAEGADGSVAGRRLSSASGNPGDGGIEEAAQGGGRSRETGGVRREDPAETGAADLEAGPEGEPAAPAPESDARDGCRGGGVRESPRPGASNEGGGGGGDGEGGAVPVTQRLPETRQYPPRSAGSGEFSSRPPHSARTVTKEGAASAASESQARGEMEHLLGGEASHRRENLGGDCRTGTTSDPLAERAGSLDSVGALCGAGPGGV
ncbi:hypothetical protein ANANG_G00188070 [Anguilla anguilla]|uniref:Uncharacterized protein n=1 Tax=Anguilla anguilla TaxID=7936 RepID=A0A9D3M2E2_ANGAN|nr:hypothetical protein ANANG_G00188070 [Anguilla anguilla]